MGSQQVDYWCFLPNGFKQLLSSHWTDESTEARECKKLPRMVLPMLAALCWQWHRNHFCAQMPVCLAPSTRHCVSAGCPGPLEPPGPPLGERRGSRNLHPPGVRPALDNLKHCFQRHWDRYPPPCHPAQGTRLDSNILAWCLHPSHFPSPRSVSPWNIFQ